MKMFEFGKSASTRFGDIYCKYYLFDKKKPVVLSFSHLTAGVDEVAIGNNPSPWGFEFLLARNLNVVSFSFIDGKYNFYRDRDLFDAIPLISNDLRFFPERLGYGISAGAYAISAFSKALNLDRILMFAPISTLKREINTWDLEAKRFLSCFDYDWADPYSDGAATTSEGYLIYDPLYYLDRLHADRYVSLNKLRMPGTGHYLARRLALLDMLPWTVDSFLAGKIPEKEFYTRLRDRKNMVEYYSWMLGGENRRISPTRARVISAAMPESVRQIYYNQSLTALSEVIRSTYQPADVLRDIALIFQGGGDIQTALALIERAHHLRPDGPFIQKKYDELKYLSIT